MIVLIKKISSVPPDLILRTSLFVFCSAASQMVITDLSEPDKRAAALSKVGLCFGFGMIVGSTLGGHLNTRYG